MLLLLEMFFTRFDRHPRVLSLSLNTTKKEEEKIGTRRDKIFAKRKKNLVSTDLFLTSCGFFVDLYAALVNEFAKDGTYSIPDTAEVEI